MKAGYLLCQFRHFLSVKGIFKTPASEYQVDILVRDIVVEDMMAHGPERRDPRARTDKEKIFFYSVG